MKGIQFKDANAVGAVEHGYILLVINDTEVWIDVEERSDGIFIAFVNDQDVFKNLGIELDGNRIKEGEFLIELNEYYKSQSITHR